MSIKLVNSHNSCWSKFWFTVLERRKLLRTQSLRASSANPSNQPDVQGAHREMIAQKHWRAGGVVWHWCLFLCFLQQGTVRARWWEQPNIKALLGIWRSFATSVPQESPSGGTRQRTAWSILEDIHDMLNKAVGSFRPWTKPHLLVVTWCLQRPCLCPTPFPFGTQWGHLAAGAKDCWH